MVTIVIPWRPQPSRLFAFDRVVQWYRETLGDVPIEIVDSGDEIFNLARCRNLGVARILDPHDVVVIGDADTIPEREALLEAIAGARTSRRVHLPYSEYRWLGAAGTAEFAAGRPLDRCTHEVVHGACSGVYVTTPATWRSHGGQDERFRGWGFEDAAWHVAHETLLGEPPRRHSGRVYALHHEGQPREGEQYDANAALMERYRSASSAPEHMRDLLAID
jgi:hypothetical protein